MPNFDGMAALAMAREMCPETPFIFVSGTIGEEYAIRALKNGATDYVLKTNLVRLPAAVERALADAKHRRERRRTEMELEAMRERLASIFASLPDVLWSADARVRRFIYVSPATREVFGEAPDAFTADAERFLEFVHEQDRAIIRNAWQRIEKDGGFDVEYRIVRRDGAVRWVNDRARLIAAANGAPSRIDGLMRDITDQVEHRGRILRLSRIREFSSQINGALVRLRDRDALFAAITRIAVETGGLCGARIGVLDAATENVHWKAWHGAWHGGDPGPLRSSARSDEETGRGLAGKALRSQLPAVSNDIAQDSGVRHREAFLERGVRAMAAFPLVVEGTAMGLLGLHAHEVGFFDQEMVNLLTEVAANISFALELMAKQERIAYLTLYDPLTGLANAAMLQKHLQQWLHAAEHDQDRLAVLVFNIERFKLVNDSFGRQAGDELLTQVAERLLQTYGDPTRVARVGADQFALVSPDIHSDEELARRIENRFEQFFGQPYQVAGTELRLSAKMGIALFPNDARDPETLFKNAEAALKKAKETGERYLFFAQDMTDRIHEKLSLENKLRRAVEKEEFILHYQPKVDLDRSMVGLEALIRWQSPELGLVPPGKFISLLEETGLILPVGDWALLRAARDLRAWLELGLVVPPVAVNVSAVQLRQRDFVDRVRRALKEVPLPAALDLEITESLIMQDVEGNIQKLNALRKHGVNIAIDDFGTGYSSLGYLAKLPVQSLKIDRSFIVSMQDEPNSMTLISTIIQLAHSLRLKVVAEGVESEEQAKFLRLLRCDEMQGFLFSKPLPKEALAELLRKAPSRPRAAAGGE
jgi:diguanylate cyclase (GGDEF)-like protein/PAS domain S-box-containing protein